MIDLGPVYTVSKILDISLKSNSETYVQFTIEPKM